MINFVGELFTLSAWADLYQAAVWAIAAITVGVKLLGKEVLVLGDQVTDLDPFSEGTDEGGGSAPTIERNLATTHSSHSL
jgi:hypothetical protein